MKPYHEIANLLKEKKISYQEIDHEPVFTSEQASKVRGISISEGAKSLLLKYGDNFVLVIIPGDKKLDSKKLKNVVNSKNIRFANPEEVEEKMNCKIGACYPFGNIISLRTIADISMDKLKYISFNPGLHDKSIRMGWLDFKMLVMPELVDISQ